MNILVWMSKELCGARAKLLLAVLSKSIVRLGSGDEIFVNGLFFSAIDSLQL